MKVFLKGLRALGVAAFLIIGGAIGSYVPQVAAQLSGVPGALVSGLGASIFSILPMPAGTLLVGQSPAQNPTAVTMSGDCTINAGGAVTCTKTNGTSLGTAAAANTGTSGANVPLENATNTFGPALQSFSGHVASNGSAPSITAGGGTSPSITGDDKDFTLTMGTAAPTTATVTFASAYTGTPNCVLIWQGNPLAAQNYSVTNTAITINQTGTSSNKITGHCAAPSGG